MSISRFQSTTTSGPMFTFGPITNFSHVFPPTNHNIFENKVPLINYTLIPKKLYSTENLSNHSLVCTTEAEHLYVELSSFWYCFMALITGIGFGISLVSNGIILYLFTSTSSLRNNPSNLIAVNLSLSDLLLCAQWPIVIYCSLTHSTWILDTDWVCQSFGFISTITGFASILTVLAMSLERALVISSNVAAKSRFTMKVAWIVTFLIWLFSFIANLPPLVLKQSRYTLDPSKTGCFLDYLPRDSTLKTYILILTMCFFIIPAILIFFSYMVILVAFKRSSLSLRHIDCEAQSSTSSDDRFYSINSPNFTIRQSRGFARLRDSFRLKRIANYRDHRGRGRYSADNLELARRASAGPSIAISETPKARHKSIEDRRQEFKRFLSESLVNRNNSGINDTPTLMKLQRNSAKTDRFNYLNGIGNKVSPVVLSKVTTISSHERVKGDETELVRTSSSLMKQPFASIQFNRVKNHVRNRQSKQFSRANIQLRLAKMSLYLIMLWLVSWAPLALLALINSLADCRRASPLTVFLASTMTKLGPTFDVFIYGISHPKIKSRFKLIIKRILLAGPSAGKRIYDFASSKAHSLYMHERGT